MEVIMLAKNLAAMRRRNALVMHYNKSIDDIRSIKVKNSVRSMITVLRYIDGWS